MNRKTIIRKIARETGVEQKVAAGIIQSFLEEVAAGLTTQHSLQLRPLGTLTVKKRRAKIGRDLTLNEPMALPEHYTVTFKPSRRLKEKVNSRPAGY